MSQFSRVRYGSVYAGVDLVYYGTRRKLEYDFVIKPAAEPSQIRMKFKGANSVRLNSNGDLVVRSGDQELTQNKPVAYQIVASGERQEIACRFRKPAALRRASS